MEAMRQSWTDDRLDEFGRRIDERFDRVDERFRQVDQRFDRVDREIGELRLDNRAVLAEIQALQRTLIQVGGGLIVAVLGILVTQL